MNQLSIELLLVEAARALNIPNPAKVRDISSEEEINDIKQIKINQVVFITTFEEEKEIFNNDLSCAVCVDDSV